MATDADARAGPRSLFRNCRLIGRRFRLAHVHLRARDHRGRDLSRPSATTAPATATWSNGLIVRDNVYGTIEEDALRRDFTVNALYYDIGDFSVLDYTGGFEDLRAGRLRLIGDSRAALPRGPGADAARGALRLPSSASASTTRPADAPLPELAPLIAGRRRRRACSTNCSSCSRPGTRSRPSRSSTPLRPLRPPASRRRRRDARRARSTTSR